MMIKLWMMVMIMFFVGCTNTPFKVEHKVEYKVEKQVVKKEPKKVIKISKQKFILEINTIPNDVNIYINKNKYNHKIKLKEGNYSIKITKKYYYPIERNISLDRNMSLNFNLKFMYANKIEKNFNEQLEKLVYRKTNDYLVFSSYDNLVTYVVAKISNGEDLSNIKFKITDSIFGGGNRIFNKEGTLDNIVNSNYPFIKISILTNKLTDIYLKSIDKLPKTVVEISLPKFVKSQFETQKMFQERVKKIIEQRDNEMKKSGEKYNKIIEMRNAEIAYIHRILPEKRKQFQETAIKLLMGDFYLTDPKYDAETQIMYVTLKLSRGIYEKRIALRVPLKIAKDFYYHLNKSIVKVNFDFTQYNIVLKSVQVNYKGHIFDLQDIK